jgi:hypothetical protein
MHRRPYLEIVGFPEIPTGCVINGLYPLEIMLEIDV